MKLRTESKVSLRGILLSHQMRARRQGSARLALLMLVSFLLGIAVGGFWFRHPETIINTASPDANGDAAPAVLSSDQSRRVSISPALPPPPKSPAAAPPAKVVTTADLKRLIPNLDTVSVSEGTKMLRTAALKEFETAARESENQINEAQQQFEQARNSGSESDQRTAMKRLQDVQFAQTEKLKDIAARLQAQITALERQKRP